METSLEDPTFLHHYITCLSTNVGILIASVLFGLIVFVWTHRQRLEGEDALNIPGCVRFGLYDRSNLRTKDDSLVNTLPEDQKPRIQALFTYPIKSCRGVELSGSEVTGLGLKHDRIFSFAQELKVDPEKSGSATRQWRFITQRERPQMALITTELWVPGPRLQASSEDEDSTGGLAANQQDNDWATHGGCLVVRFPSIKSIFGIKFTETITIKLPLSPTAQRAESAGYFLEPLIIWKDCPLALNMTSEIALTKLVKLKQFLGISNPIALFRIEETNNLRTITRSLPADKTSKPYPVGFGDAFPVSLLNLASVHSVDTDLPGTSKLKHSLDARRFRANIYITGPPAFEEDTWRRINIYRSSREDVLERNIGRASKGDVLESGTYHIACRTARCTLPNVDPVSGVRDKSEPFETLKRTRVVDEGAKPHSSLGMSVLPLFEKGVLKVGDRVEVLEKGEHVYEKMFN
ncbi:uncharacterized protein RCC_03492 [Ramularia collo-cygni]|uniref:MOSC domain-containing protein n=1 Tax=Ramularia collo-cygni TaxID=112498 RepID=A0A2D3UUC5_9PEZI|nr:uncharacterized protein RCC_03492 [Ramularia collo-cygni]CZT17655.1 uncharacterized protein RCC_03492 [Ramularia collo-cygni]